MIDLSPDHLALVKQILAAHVPGLEVRAFGSRVTGQARDYSDLDVAIISRQKTDRAALYRLEEAFVASDLPFRVDVLDWQRLSESFRGVVEQGYVIIQEADG